MSGSINAEPFSVAKPLYYLLAVILGKHGRRHTQNPEPRTQNLSAAK